MTKTIRVIDKAKINDISLMKDGRIEMEFEIEKSHLIKEKKNTLKVVDMSKTIKDFGFNGDIAVELLENLIKDRIKELEDELEETNLCISDAEDTGKIKNGIKSKIEELKRLLG